MALAACPRPAGAADGSSIPACFKGLSGNDSALLAGTDGRPLYAVSAATPSVPASTLKILTAAAALHHLGASYRFPTEFYLDPQGNLKVKGYGDPMLISEVWREIADRLAARLSHLPDLVVDSSYFDHPIRIPGRERSTNPYDAPVGALCANFNTVFFARDAQGRIVSAEPQTPMLPFARRKVATLGLQQGRYTFSHSRDDGARYAAELLLHFLREKGLKGEGRVRPGRVTGGDRLLLRYRSPYALEEVVAGMMEFSNNFVANQLLISMGAQIQGPPGTLSKGLGVLRSYAARELGRPAIVVEEGSGISRANRLSALDMLAVLRAFLPHRHLLTRRENALYKTGSLRGVRTRAGYLEGLQGKVYPFVLFLQGNDSAAIDRMVDCLARWANGKRPGKRMSNAE